MSRKLTNQELNRMSPQEFIQSEKTAITVILDNVRSRFNIGSVFRTADAYRIEEIILCGITATPPSAEIHKSALGAEDTVRWSYCAETADIVIKLKEKGYKIVSVEQAENAIMLPQVQPDNTTKYALIFGNEVKGVDQSVINLSDDIVEIPQYGTKHSLNIAVAAGIVIWHYYQGFIRSVF